MQMAEQHFTSIQLSHTGFDQGGESLLQTDNNQKWCCQFDENNEPTVKFTFKRPAFVRGYSLTFANDCEHRDPVKW